MNAERLVEDKSLREKYVGRVDVLDKVKVLSLLPDGEHLTTKQVAEYYEVDKITIDLMLKRHKDEFESDGIKLIKGNELKQYKSTHLQDVSELKRVPALTLFTRRAILRTGMLLRDSEVAKQVRTYLLNVEENAPKEIKHKSFDNSRTGQENLIILNCVLESIHNDGTLQQGLEKASRLINKKFSTTNSRWHNKIKKIVSNDTLTAIKNNQGKNKLKNNNKVKHIESQEIDYVEVLNNKFDDVIRENIELVKLNKEFEIENNQLNDEISKLKKSLKKKIDDVNLMLNIIGRAVKQHEYDRLKYSINDDLTVTSK